MTELVQNKKARLNYEILETLEAGIELLGLEVKSLRAGHGNLLGAYVKIRGDEGFLVGATIPPYQPNNTPGDYDASRSRRLLITKKEIAMLTGLENQKGLTVVPLAMYNKGRKIKLSVAIARGKKQYDKREVLKKRDAKREMDKARKEH